MVQFKKQTRKMRGWGILRAGEGINLVISNEYMDDTIRVIKLIKKLGVLIDGVGERVKH